jgi:GGDEF domain-containing protein
MDSQARQEIETAVQALHDALTGLISFTMTLRPTLRNEIFQICGHHLERAREAKERLESLLVDPDSPKKE